MPRSAKLPARIACAATGLALLSALLGSREALAHEIVPPKAVNQPAPTWPKNRAYAYDVVVPLVLLVSADGSVTDVQVEAKLGEDFDALAVDAAKRWTFQPALSRGRPVAAKVRAVMRFVGNSSHARPTTTSAAALGANSVELAGSAAPVALASKDAEVTIPASTAVAKAEDQARSAHEAGSRSNQPVVDVLGDRTSPPRSASQVTRGQDVIRAAPHRTGGDLLQVVPGVFITQHSGQGKAYQVFYRGFDAVHGQDLEFWVGGAPVNEVSNIHGQGYADLHFVMPEIVSQITVLPGNYRPDQGDFAVAGTIRYELSYREPGITVKGTLGSFGERRVFLGYHRKDASPGSFAAFEAQSTNGFGPGRAADRTSAVVQEEFRLGHGRMRWLASGYAGRFDSPGVVRLADIEAGELSRFDTYGVNQGGFSSRYQLVGEYSGTTEGSRWSIAPYVVRRGLHLKQNYTGYLLDRDNGDTTELSNESTTFGTTGRYLYPVHWFSPRDSIEAGMSLRNDWVSQSQRNLGLGSHGTVATRIDAKIRAMDVAGFIDLAILPFSRVKVRAGLRVDGLAYDVQDNTPVVDGSTDPAPNATLAAGRTRTAFGTHYGPRLTVDGAIAPNLHGIISYGEGFRSPQARSLGDGEKAPFTTVRSMETGLRYSTADLSGSVAAFRTTLHDDLVFDAAAARNEAVPSSQRIGGTLEFTVKPTTWFLSSGSATYTRATFTGADSRYREGDRLPYVPGFILRHDVAFTPTLGRWWARPLTARFGAALTGMFDRPQPYGVFGHNVFLVDAVTELRLAEVGVGLDVFNLLGAHWYDSEFTYSANWSPGGMARLVPERYVTAGAPRVLLATVSLFVD
jgi:outer membrane cobalamin receptor